MRKLYKRDAVHALHRQPYQVHALHRQSYQVHALHRQPSE